MSRSRREDFLLPVKKIYSYCDKHKKLHNQYDDDWWRSSEYENCSSRKLSYRDDKERIPSHECSRGEILVKSSAATATDDYSLQAAAASIRLPHFKSRAFVRGSEQRRTRSSTKLDSPTTSCLKTVGSRKKSGMGKRVNFNEASFYAQKSTEDYYQENYQEDYQECNDEYVHDIYEYSERKHYDGSSSYYELPEFEDFKGRSGTAVVKPPSRHSSASYSSHYRSSNYWPDDDESHDSETKIMKLEQSIGLLRDPVKDSYYDDDEKSFRRTSMRERSRVQDDLDLVETPRYETEIRRYREYPCEEHSSSRQNLRRNVQLLHRRSKSLHSRIASGYRPRSVSPSEDSVVVNEDEKRLLDELNRMSLNSSTCCFDRRDNQQQRQEKQQKQPRVVKQRNGSRRAAVKRMLVYPSEGEKGPPITLFKKWSNVTCHVKGDSSNGFRYKVYYLQKFESKKWKPDGKTGNPFHRVEDAECSTDYG